jgi:hypothetical protein
MRLLCDWYTFDSYILALHLFPNPYTLILILYTLIPNPYTLILILYTLIPNPYTLILTPLHSNFDLPSLPL